METKTPITEEGLIEKGWKLQYSDACEVKYTNDIYTILISTNEPPYSLYIPPKYIDVCYMEQLDILLNAINQVEQLNNE